MTNKLILLATCLAFAATGTAYAGTRYNQPSFYTQPDSKAGKIVGGIINGNGTVVYGSGFQVSHPNTGEYIVTIPSNEFSKCPVISLTPAGAGSNVPIANLLSYGCGGSGVSLTIYMIGASNGQPEDNAFHFMAIQP